jgi:hypothetical protein
MRRLLIFSLLGPPMALLFIALLSLVTTGQTIAPMEDLLLLPYFYVLGLVPSLLAAVGDWLLAKKVGLLPRLGGSACVGFLVSSACVGFLVSAHFAFNDVFQMMKFGLVGAFTSVVCSMLVLTAAPKSNITTLGQG